MIDLSGKVALVTGASRGIGLAIARELSDCGAHVVLAARSVARIQALANEISASGPRAVAAPCDVASFADVASAVERCENELGSLDILVNNAAVIEPIALLEESDPTLWARAVDVNLKGVYHGMRAAIPAMRRGSGGTIVNLSSGAANSVLEGWSHYCATKAAAKRLTECAHEEAAGLGIRVVGLSPGTVATDMMAKIKESGVNRVSRLDWSVHIPPEWAAKAVVYLCGPEGAQFAGTDFSLKTAEGRRRVGLEEHEL